MIELSCEKLKEKIWNEIIENRRQGTVQEFCSLVDCDDEFAVSAAMVRLVSEGKMELMDSPDESFREDGGAILQGSYKGNEEAIVDDMFTKIASLDQKYASEKKLNLETAKLVDSEIRKKILLRINC